MRSERGLGLAVALLRVSLGALFIAHALLKWVVFSLEGTAAFFENVGFPGFAAYPVFAIELLGGILLVLGLGTRWAALCLVPVMLGATAAHWSNGWVFTNANGGWEFTAFLSVVCVAVFLSGRDGSWSLGRVVRFAGPGQADRERSQS